MSVLKAALNLAFHNGHIATDEAWRRVKPFPKTDAARITHLRIDQVPKIIEHLPEDFRALVQAALVTGARYGELTNLRTEDVDLRKGTIFLRETKNGRPRHSFLPEQGRQLFAKLVEGKSVGDFVFLRSTGRPWKTSEQARPMRRACEKAGIVPAVSFHGLRHTFGTMLAEAGAPMRVIAEALGHSDTRITEKHYAHITPSYVAETVRRSLPSMNLLLPLESLER